MHTEVWYEIEYSANGADDWYADAASGTYYGTYGTLESAKRAVANQPKRNLFDYRIVRKTVTVEPVEG